MDSLLAADFTAGYSRLQSHCAAEARRKRVGGRYPLDFAQLLTIDTHADHLKMVNTLARSARPAIVIAASGKCSGARFVNDLKAMPGDPRRVALFCGYQAAGTLGRAIQQDGARAGWVELDGQRITIRAGIHTRGGYPAHADQADMLRFIGRMPREVRIVHGDDAANQSLAERMRLQHLRMEVVQ